MFEFQSSKFLKDFVVNFTVDELKATMEIICRNENGTGYRYDSAHFQWRELNSLNQTSQNSINILSGFGDLELLRNPLTAKNEIIIAKYVFSFKINNNINEFEF